MLIHPTFYSSSTKYIKSILSKKIISDVIGRNQSLSFSATLRHEQYAFHAGNKVMEKYIEVLISNVPKAFDSLA